MRTRILLPIKVVRIYNQWSELLKALQGSILSVHGPQLTFEPLELLIFNADPDLAFHSNADPDLKLASKTNNADACKFRVHL